MDPRPSHLLRVLVAGAAALALTVGAGTSAGRAATATTAIAQSSTSLSAPFCAPAALGHRSCLGLALKRSSPRPAVAPGTAPPAPGGGYGPQDIQSAYGLSGTASTKGVGQTIALIEAFRDPAAAADLATYRTYFGLPACTVANGCFQQVDMSGGASRTDAGWEQETSLDMDAASAACPLCHIVIVESVDDSDANLIAAVQRAVSLGATVLNLSFGGCEGGSGTYDNVFRLANLPISVATGDNGYFAPDNAGCATGTPEYPASSPYVTAVGGTSLTPSGGARGWSETAWRYSYSTQYGAQGGGSGCSSIEPKPSWQTDTGCARRTAADVSADADPNTGLAVFVSDPAAGGGWNVFGGTSLSAPLVAAMYALAGAPATAVDGHIWYLGARVNDVTSGSNAASTSDCTPAYLCNAVAGYDGPTGVGTPSGPPGANTTPPSSPPPPFRPQGVGQPAVTLAPDGTQLIFWQGAGGHLMEAWWQGHWHGPVDWSAANGWAASLGSAPSVALAPDGTQIVFWQGPGGHLFEAWWNGHWNGPVDWTSANGWGTSLTSAPSVRFASDGTQLVFWQGAGGHLIEVWWNGHWNGPVDWTAANRWGAPLGSAPSVALAPDGTQIIFWQGAGGHLIEVWWNGHWNGPVDWTTAYGWPPSLASAPSVTFAPDGTQLIFWKTAAGHLDEAWWNGHWNGPADWMAGNGWPASMTSAPSVTIASDGTQLIFWQGSGAHLMEVWWQGHWNGPVDWSS